MGFSTFDPPRVGEKTSWSYEMLFFMVRNARNTLPETNSSPMKTPMFPCKYHQTGGFSMAMLVLGRV